MNTQMTEQVRQLAYHIWSSAGKEYDRAIDFWLMAEQMVSEISTMTSRIAQATMGQISDPVPTNAEEFSQIYTDRVRELAHAMWEGAEKRIEYTLDFWLSAERHTRAIAEAAMRTAGTSMGAEKVVSQAFQSFSSEAYLERIRRTAYFMWDAAGNQYGRSLDYWLAAERQVLQSILATAPADATAEPAQVPQPLKAPSSTEAKPAKPTKPAEPAAAQPATLKPSTPKPATPPQTQKTTPAKKATAPTKSTDVAPASTPAKTRRTRTTTKKAT